MRIIYLSALQIENKTRKQLAGESPTSLGIPEFDSALTLYMTITIQRSRTSYVLTDLNLRRVKIILVSSFSPPWLAFVSVTIS